MKFVFWDWNGTLMNDAQILWRSFNELATAHGGEHVSFERYRSIYRHPVRDMYAEVGVDFSKHSLEQMASKWHKIYSAMSADIGLHHDAVDVLQALQDLGSRQVVVSALPHNFLGNIVSRFSVRHFFEHLAGIPDELAHSKVGIAIEMADRLGARGGDITVIGDSSHDAEVAKALSAQCILVARGAESRERLDTHGFRVLDDFSEIARRKD
jgi:phosphoglycolate phosphatase